MHRDTDECAAPRMQEQGQTMAEYAVVLGVITLVIIGALTGVGQSVVSVIADVTTRIRA